MKYDCTVPCLPVTRYTLFDNVVEVKIDDRHRISDTGLISAGMAVAMATMTLRMSIVVFGPATVEELRQRNGTDSSDVDSGGGGRAGKPLGALTTLLPLLSPSPP